jgi:hypothetical protein
MNSDELSLLTDDKIDYESLSEDVLKELALGDELFIATSALVELRMRKSSIAAPTAWEILSTSHGDRYLQAAALSVLFGMNQEQAINFMSQQVQFVTPYILNTMMELMIENESDFKSEPGLSIVRVIKERLKKCDDKLKFPEPEVKDRFLKIYD